MNGQTLGFHSKSIAIETKKAMRKSRLQRHFPCRGGEACVSVIPVGFTLAGLVAGGGGGGKPAKSSLCSCQSEGLAVGSSPISLK